MRIGTVVLVIWLLIGAVAAGQRDEFSGGTANCSKLGTIAVTVVAGPLNYAGINPRIRCTTPEPSR
jgi:hypothetical protein